MKTDTQRLDELEKRVAELERPTVPWPVFPEAFNKCPKCGITLEKVMGYVCQRSDCPTGLGSPIYMSL